MVPPGGQRLPKAPDILKVPSSTLVSATLVDEVSFWRAPGQPQAVLAWEQAHLSRRFTPGDAGFGPPSWDRTFSLSAVPGVLNARDLLVEVAGAGNGQTAIRVDAQVAWQPPRPASSLVPSAARVLTITQLASSLPGARRPPAPVTITDPAVTRRIASLINGLLVFPLEYASCPAFMGGGLQLTFRARSGGPALAVANTDGVCHEVWLTIGGKQQPGLTDPASLDAQIRKIAGLR